MKSLLTAKASIAPMPGVQLGEKDNRIFLDLLGQNVDISGMFLDFLFFLGLLG